MANRNLSTETMVKISAAWLDPKHERPLLEAHPVTRAVMPTIEAAHAGVLELLRPSGAATSDKALSDLSAKEEASDQIHDGKARGIWYLLTGGAELAEDPSLKVSYLALRDRLFPKGLATTTASYSDEAGHVTAVKEHLDAATHAQLKKVKSVENRTLDDEATRWIEAGLELGRLESQRSTLLSQRDKQAAKEARGGFLKARNQWVKAANVLPGLLDLVEGLSDEARSRILGPLEEAEAKADRRSARGREPVPQEIPPAATASGSPNSGV